VRAQSTGSPDVRRQTPKWFSKEAWGLLGPLVRESWAHRWVSRTLWSTWTQGKFYPGSREYV